VIKLSGGCWNVAILELVYLWTARAINVLGISDRIHKTDFLPRQLMEKMKKEDDYE
jgi:hypothetical protein